MLRRTRPLAIVGLALGLAFSSTAVDAAPGVRPKDAWNCPKTHPIKGNINKKRKTKIYHTTASRWDNDTKPEICFAKPADAVAAGYRTPLR